MPRVMIEIYWLIFVYKFTPSLTKSDGNYILRLVHPQNKYFTAYMLGEKIKQYNGVEPWRIFKRKKGYPPR